VTEENPNILKVISDAAEREPPVVQEQSTPDPGIDLEEHKLEFQIECLRQELGELKDTHSLRLRYAGRIFWLVVAWLACVVFCIVLAGFRLGDLRSPILC
jgi:hypothetical protein